MLRLRLFVVLLLVLTLQSQAQQWRLVADSISVELLSESDVKPVQYIGKHSRDLLVLASSPLGAIGAGGLGFFIGRIIEKSSHNYESLGGLFLGSLAGAVIGPIITMRVIKNKVDVYTPLTLYDEMPTILTSPDKPIPNRIHDGLSGIPLVLRVLIDKTGTAQIADFMVGSELSLLNDQLRNIPRSVALSTQYNPATYKGKRVHSGVLVHLRWESIDQGADSTTQNK